MTKKGNVETILLTGPDSCGKTTTINLVYNRQLATGGISTGKMALGGNPSDFEYVVNYGSKRVAFFLLVTIRVRYKRDSQIQRFAGGYICLRNKHPVCETT